MMRAGIRSVRDNALWAAIEPRAGELGIPAPLENYITAATESGLVPLLVLVHGNRLYDGGLKPHSPTAVAAYARYAGFVAAHFAGRAGFYEIWNEWDQHSTKDPGSPEEYVRLVAAASREIRRADSKAKVLAGSITSTGIRDGFLDDIIDRGVLAYADGLAIHPYNHSSKNRRPEDWADWMTDLNSHIEARIHRKVALYITEMGWPTQQSGTGVTEQRQAEYLARLYLLARTMPFIKGVWWYDLRNDGPDPKEMEHNFGVLRSDLEPKVGYHALQGVSAIVSRANFAGREDLESQALYLLRFREPDGENIWTLWTSDETQHSLELTTIARKPPSLNIRLATGTIQEQSWVAKPLIDAQFARRWTLTVSLGPMPLIVRGNLGGVQAIALPQH